MTTFFINTACPHNNRSIHVVIITSHREIKESHYPFADCQCRIKGSHSLLQTFSESLCLWRWQYLFQKHFHILDSLHLVINKTSRGNTSAGPFHLITQESSVHVEALTRPLLKARWVRLSWWQNSSTHHQGFLLFSRTEWQAFPVWELHPRLTEQDMTLRKIKNLACFTLLLLMIHVKGVAYAKSFNWKKLTSLDPTVGFSIPSLRKKGEFMKQGPNHVHSNTKSFCSVTLRVCETARKCLLGISVSVMLAACWVGSHQDGARGRMRELKVRSLPSRHWAQSLLH